MAAQRVHPCCYGPDVQVVDVDDASKLLYRLYHLLHFKLPWRPFQQDMGAVPDYGVGAPGNKAGYQDRDYRVYGRDACGKRRKACRKDRHRRYRVVYDVHKGALDVDAPARVAPEEEHYDEVARQAYRRGGNEDGRVYLTRLEDARVALSAASASTFTSAPANSARAIALSAIWRSNASNRS